MAVAPDDRSNSGGRRVLFSIILGLLVWALAEFGAFLAFLQLDGERFSQARVVEQMRAAMRAGASADEAAVRLWQESSRQLDRIARANGIRYFHFLQPNQYVAGSKPMGEREAAVAITENSPYRAAAEAGYPELIRAGQALSEAGVRFDDLTGIFRDVEAPVYRDDCCHLNPLGNRILASGIARFLREGSDRPAAPPG